MSSLGENKLFVLWVRFSCYFTEFSSHLQSFEFFPLNATELGAGGGGRGGGGKRTLRLSA